MILTVQSKVGSPFRTSTGAYLFVALVCLTFIPGKSVAISALTTERFCPSYVLGNQGHLVNSQHSRIAPYLPERKLQQLYDLIDTLAESDPWIKEATEMLEQEQVEVIVSGIIGPEMILTTGLKNVHVGGNKTVIARRNFTEATHLQLSFNEYAAYPPDDKPKYAALIPKGLPISSLGYGNNLYRVALSEVRDRLTFSIAGDSYNRMPFLPKIPFNFDSDFTGPRNPNQVTPIPDWSFLFLPWKYRKLLAPSFAEMLRVQKTEIPDHFQDPLITTHRSREYIELQVFGELVTPTVEYFGPAVRPQNPRQ